MNKAILLGPPGAGKGTQAVKVAARLGVNLISSGDLFRDHLARETELGLAARSYMNAGDLVPDDVTIAMVMEWVSSPEQAAGFVLDGFPRSLDQAKALDEAMAERGGIDRALYINVSRDELLRRLGGRVICADCQTPYHQSLSPPKVEGKCDRCGGSLYQRKDDEPGAVANRLQVYERQTAPVVEYYRRSGVLTEIDGEKPIEEVWLALEAAIS